MMRNKLFKILGAVWLFFCFFVIWLDVLSGQYWLAFFELLSLALAGMLFLEMKLGKKMMVLIVEQGDLLEKMRTLMDAVIKENNMLKTKKEFWAKSDEVEIPINRSASEKKDNIS